MIQFVDVVYDGDDYEFEISLEPKDPCCFGFKVVYHNGSFLLLQNIESIDIPFLLFVASRDMIEDYIHVSEFVILTNRTAADKITAIYHSYLISDFSVYAHLWINKHIKHIKTVAAGI